MPVGVISLTPDNKAWLGTAPLLTHSLTAQALNTSWLVPRQLLPALMH